MSIAKLGLVTRGHDCSSIERIRGRLESLRRGMSGFARVDLMIWSFHQSCIRSMQAEFPFTTELVGSEPDSRGMKEIYYGRT